MSDIRERFRRVVNNLEQIIEILAGFANNANSKIEAISNADRPLSNENYNIWFDAVERGRNVTIPELYQQVERLRTMTEEYNKNIDIVNELHNRLAKLINDNKFKYGLKGQIKRSIELNVIQPQGLTEEGSHALEQPFAETPYERNNGGKKSLKKRLRSKRSKKLRKK